LKRRDNYLCDWLATKTDTRCCSKDSSYRWRGTAMHQALVSVVCVAFLPPDAVRWRGICYGDVAVCASVTLMYCAQTTESIITRPSPECIPAVQAIFIEGVKSEKSGQRTKNSANKSQSFTRGQLLTAQRRCAQESGGLSAITELLVISLLAEISTSMIVS